jgi:hypothetical protein
MESVPPWLKCVKGGPAGPFARPGGHGILRRFSSPGGEGMQTHYFHIIALTQRSFRIGDPFGTGCGESLARARLDGRHG